MEENAGRDGLTHLRKTPVSQSGEREGEGSLKERKEGRTPGRQRFERKRNPALL